MFERLMGAWAFYGMGWVAVFGRLMYHAARPVSRRQTSLPASPRSGERRLCSDG